MRRSLQFLGVFFLGVHLFIFFNDSKVLGCFFSKIFLFYLLQMIFIFISFNHKGRKNIRKKTQGSKGHTYTQYHLVQIPVEDCFVSFFHLLAGRWPKKRLLLFISRVITIARWKNVRMAFSKLEVYFSYSFDHMFEGICVCSVFGPRK